MERNWLVITALVLSVLHPGSSLQCFHCFKEIGGDGICRDDNGVRPASEECSFRCVTHTVAPVTMAGVESSKIVARICAEPTYCYKGAALFEKQMGVTTESCTSCDTNYCNSATAATPAVILVAILAVKCNLL